MLRLRNTVAALALLLGWVVAGSASAYKTDLTGVGLILGDPTGLSAKYFLAPDLALDGALGFTSLGPGLAVHADIAYQGYFEEITRGKLLYYLGGGAELAQEGSVFAMGLRFQAGLEYFFHKAPFAVFVELAPTFQFAGRYGLRARAGLGGRYYFF